MSLPSARQFHTQPQEESELLLCSWQPELQELGIWAAHGRGGRPDWAGFWLHLSPAPIWPCGCEVGWEPVQVPASFSMCLIGDRMTTHSPVGGMGLP